MIAWGVTTVLIVLSAFHLLWALGYWVPWRDETALARAVVGSPGVTRMPGPVACATVGVVLFFLALLPQLEWVPYKPVLMGAVAAGLVVRAVASYVPALRQHAPEEPFATLDRRAYAPLCLALGAGFVWIATNGG